MVLTVGPVRLVMGVMTLNSIPVITTISIAGMIPIISICFHSTVVLPWAGFEGLGFRVSGFAKSRRRGISIGAPPMIEDPAGIRPAIQTCCRRCSKSRVESCSALYAQI